MNIKDAFFSIGKKIDKIIRELFGEEKKNNQPTPIVSTPVNQPEIAATPSRKRKLEFVESPEPQQRPIKKSRPSIKLTNYSNENKDASFKARWSFFKSHTGGYVRRGVKGYNHFDLILGEQELYGKNPANYGELFLGSLPEKSRGMFYLPFIQHNDHLKITQAGKDIHKPVKLIIDCTQLPEKKPRNWHNPVQPKDWQEQGVEEIINIPANDHGIGKQKEQEHVKTLYPFMTQYFPTISNALANKKSVYIHCKAGQGRSAFTTLCYLVTGYRQLIGVLPTIGNLFNEGKTEEVMSVIKEAFTLMKEKHKQTTIKLTNPITLQEIIEFAVYYSKNTGKKPEDYERLTEKETNRIKEIAQQQAKNLRDQTPEEPTLKVVSINSPVS
ncbi:MAG: hypothetical protein EPO11_10305 [Gammaproteobacteria bacterium]|nr:MAG: hypothetical protein EPO11_10305 [Gammaproteobacteria bacterium]